MPSCPSRKSRRPPRRFSSALPFLVNHQHQHQRINTSQPSTQVLSLLTILNRHGCSRLNRISPSLNTPHLPSPVSCPLQAHIGISEHSLGFKAAGAPSHIIHTLRARTHIFNIHTHIRTYILARTHSILLVSTLVCLSNTNCSSWGTTGLLHPGYAIFGSRPSKPHQEISHTLSTPMHSSPHHHRRLHPD